MSTSSLVTLVVLHVISAVSAFVMIADIPPYRRKVTKHLPVRITLVLGGLLTAVGGIIFLIGVLIVEMFPDCAQSVRSTYRNFIADSS